MASHGPAIWVWLALCDTLWHIFAAIIVVLTMMSKIKVVTSDDQ
jgi:hypothetical protein